MKTILKVISIVISSSVLFPMISSAQDAVEGENIFKKKCKICHTITKGDKAKIGPNLYGIYDRHAGEFEGYKYSKDLIEANLTWDQATLDVYLLKPKDVVKKSKMIFAGLKKEKDRKDIIEYLKTLKN